MNTTTSGLDQAEVEIFAVDATDEALENAAGGRHKAGNYTLSFCTGLSECPS